MGSTRMETAVAHVVSKSLDDPDEVRRVPRGTVEIYNLGEVVIGRTVWEPGWHWAEAEAGGA